MARYNVWQNQSVFNAADTLDDDARNQDTGGTGLGLAIARDIAIGHGGKITLGRSELGGLWATISVPV